MSEHDDERVMRVLARLPAVAPDAARAERTRARCHQLGARRAQALARRAERRNVIRRAFEPAVVGAFSLTYVIVLVHQLLRWHGVI